MSEELRLGTTNRRLDSEAVSHGKDFECPYRPGLTVTLSPAAMFNPRFQNAVANYAMRLRNEIERRSADDEAKSEELKGAVDVIEQQSDPQFLVDAIVIDMKGLYNAEGEEVPYSRERGLAILADPGNADVRAWIASLASRMGQWYADTVEADAGNSSSGSSGKKAGAARSGKTRS